MVRENFLRIPSAPQGSALFLSYSVSSIQDGTPILSKVSLLRFLPIQERLGEVFSISQGELSATNGERSLRALMETLINYYFVGTAPSLALAYSVGRKKGLNGITLLFGAVMLAASWPLWGTGAVLLAVVGLMLTVLAAATLVAFIVFCVCAFLWIFLLLKCMEIMGWFKT
jgi:hypothetical protein